MPKRIGSDGPVRQPDPKNTGRDRKLNPQACNNSTWSTWWANSRDKTGQPTTRVTFVKISRGSAMRNNVCVCVCQSDLV